MLIYGIIICWLLYRVYTTYFKKPSFQHPKFDSKFPIRKFSTLHALKRPFFVSKNNLLDVSNHSLGLIWLYSIYSYVPTKRWNIPTNEWIMIQIKNPQFSFWKLVCIARDINENFWSNFFITTIIPILFFWPLVWVSYNEGTDSWYSIPFVYETFDVPTRFILIGIALLFIIWMRKFYAISYTTKRVGMENTSFEKLLDVFSYDPLQARIILTPDTLQSIYEYFQTQIAIEQPKRILQNSNLWHAQSLSFMNDSIHVYISKYNHPTLAKLDEPHIQQFLKQFQSMLTKGWLKF